MISADRADLNSPKLKASRFCFDVGHTFVAGNQDGTTGYDDGALLFGLIGNEPQLRCPNQLDATDRAVTGLVANNVASHSVLQRNSANATLLTNDVDVGPGGDNGTIPFKCPMTAEGGDFHLTRPNPGTPLEGKENWIDMEGIRRVNYTRGAFETILTPGCEEKEEAT